MDREVKSERIEISLACNWSALTAVQQERQRALYRQLRADVEEVLELEDGYAFRHSPDRAMLLAVAEFVSNERLCCPFFEFGITVERAGAGVAAHDGSWGGQASLGGGDGHLGLSDRGSTELLRPSYARSSEN